MASKSTASLALFFALNLLFFSSVSACGTCSTPAPKPKPIPKPSPKQPCTCPRDTLKLGVCANVLGGGLLGGVIGNPLVNHSPCCALIDGLVDLEAAICLCTAIKANVLGINLNVDLSLSVILNTCGKKVPSGWKCA